jgi:hypothetical protein
MTSSPAAKETNWSSTSNLEDLAISAGDLVLQNNLPETLQAPQVIGAEVQPAGLLVAGNADPSSVVWDEASWLLRGHMSS